MTITTSTYNSPRTIPKLLFTTSLLCFIYRSIKLGHPVPELNFVSEENKGSLQAAQNTRLFVITIKFILKRTLSSFSARYNTDYQLTDFSILHLFFTILLKVVSSMIIPVVASLLLEFL
jgi:hypothetical protein